MTARARTINAQATAAAAEVVTRRLTYCAGCVRLNLFTSPIRRVCVRTFVERHPLMHNALKKGSPAASKSAQKCPRGASGGAVRVRPPIALALPPVLQDERVQPERELGRAFTNKPLARDAAHISSRSNRAWSRAWSLQLCRERPAGHPTARPAHARAAVAGQTSRETAACCQAPPGGPTGPTRPFRGAGALKFRPETPAGRRQEGLSVRARPSPPPLRRRCRMRELSLSGSWAARP